MGLNHGTERIGNNLMKKVKKVKKAIKVTKPSKKVKKEKSVKISKKIDKMEEGVVKRPRGRPRKNPVMEIDSIDSLEPKKRGRPKKNTKVITKSYDKYANSRHKYEKFADPLVPTTLGKILGYCPSCSNYISNLDKVLYNSNASNSNNADSTKDEYLCFKCDKVSKGNKLLKEPKPESIKEKPKNKKEYMERCLLVENNIPMNPHELISKKELGEISAPPANTIE